MFGIKNSTLIKLLRFIGACVGAAISALGIYAIYVSHTDIKTVVNALYQIIFGLLIITAELRFIKLLVWFSFLVTFIGLGGFYIFVGGLALGSQWYEIMITVIACAIGLIYCSFGCCCKSVEADDEAIAVAKSQM